MRNNQNNATNCGGGGGGVVKYNGRKLLPLVIGSFGFESLWRRGETKSIGGNRESVIRSSCVQLFLLVMVSGLWGKGNTLW